MTAHHQSPSWRKAARLARPRIAEEIRRGDATCVDCGRWLPPDTPRTHWEVGHRVSVLRATAAGWTEAEINAYSNLGPSHGPRSGRACNQRAGATERQQRDRARRAEGKGYPEW
jgi:hypothetical protein